MTMIRVFGGITIWPYSLGQLRLDEPTRSFSNDPSDWELAVYGVFRVQPTAPPEFSPALEKLIEVHPVQQDGAWRRAWQVVELSEEERQAYYRATHPPQWIAFNDALPAEVNTLLAQAQALDQRIYGGLLVGLGKAADGDSRVFLGTWQKARAAGLIPPEMVAQIQALATSYDLPAEFVAGLG